MTLFKHQLGLEDKFTSTPTVSQRAACCHTLWPPYTYNVSHTKTVSPTIYFGMWSGNSTYRPRPPHTHIYMSTSSGVGRCFGVGIWWVANHDDGKRLWHSCLLSVFVERAPLTLLPPRSTPLSTSAHYPYHKTYIIHSLENEFAYTQTRHKKENRQTNGWQTFFHLKTICSVQQYFKIIAHCIFFSKKSHNTLKHLSDSTRCRVVINPRNGLKRWWYTCSVGDLTKRQMHK